MIMTAIRYTNTVSALDKQCKWGCLANALIQFRVRLWNQGLHQQFRGCRCVLKQEQFGIVISVSLLSWMLSNLNKTSKTRLLLKILNVIDPFDFSYNMTDKNPNE